MTAGTPDVAVIVPTLATPERADPLRRALAGFATQFDSPRQIVERAVMKVHGQVAPGSLIVAKVAAPLTAVVQAFQLACPNPAEA